jgi:hypothetical protein
VRYLVAIASVLTVLSALGYLYNGLFQPHPAGSSKLNAQLH